MLFTEEQKDIIYNNIFSYIIQTLGEMAWNEVAFLSDYIIKVEMIRELSLRHR